MLADELSKAHHILRSYILINGVMMDGVRTDGRHPGILTPWAMARIGALRSVCARVHVTGNHTSAMLDQGDSVISSVEADPGIASMTVSNGHISRPRQQCATAQPTTCPPLSSRLRTKLTIPRPGAPCRLDPSGPMNLPTGNHHQFTDTKSWPTYWKDFVRGTWAQEDCITIW